MLLGDFLIKGGLSDVSDHFVNTMDTTATSIIQISFGIAPNPPELSNQLSIVMPEALGCPFEANESTQNFFDAMSTDISQISTMLQLGATNIATNGVGLPPSSPLTPTSMIGLLASNGVNENLARAILDWAVNLIPVGESRLLGIFPVIV